MREIRLSGSGEGAVLSRPYLISSQGLGFAQWSALCLETSNGIGEHTRPRVWCPASA